MRDMYTEFINPIYGTHDGLEVVIVGAIVVGSASALFWVAIEGDGKTIKDSFDTFVVDVRFSDGKWQDVSPGPDDAEE